MAIFASTTTSGYGDPLKAMSIKVLEQRLRDQQAQAAAQQPDTAMMGTIPGGIGHVLGQIGDRMQQGRSEQAAAEGRTELAGIIAQGPQGPDGSWSPQQMSVLARRSPEFMEKLTQNQHERGNLNITEKGLTSRNDATIGGQNQRSTAEIAGRAANVATEQQGANARQAVTSSTQLELGKLADTGADRRQGSSQAHETSQTRLKSELDATAAELKYAQENRLQDRTIAAQEKMAGLQSELRKGEATQAAGFKSAEQDKQFAQDDKIKGLDREATAANLKLQLANQSGIAADRIAAEKDLARINNDLNIRRDEIKATQALVAQTQAEKATSADVSTKTKSAEDIAKAEATAKADALAKDPKRAEAVRAAETDYRKGLSHLDNLEEATRILEHPKGIYTGAAQYAAPVAGGVPMIGGMMVDKEKAHNTARFNTIVGEDAIRDMATTLKGSSTNYEMGEFKKMKNDPNISDAQRANQLRKVVKAARADLEAQAKEVQAIGGDIGRVNKAMSGGGDTPADPAAAQAAIDGGAPFDAVAARFKGKGGDPSVLKPKGP